MSLVIGDHLTNEPIGAICMLGRGIERVQIGAGSVWRPTRYLERPGPDGGHAGRRELARLDDDTSLIAGSNANLLATCTLFERLKHQGAAARMVIFAAGRPPYLAAGPDPTLSEGLVLRDIFRRRVHLDDRTETIIVTENRNTYDDINSTITLATARSIGHVAMITLRVHLPRAMEFARQAPDAHRDVRLTFVAAEDLLQERYAKHPCILRAIAAARSCAAYQRTAAREAHGLQALRAGTYWTHR
jgi:hypothetical protein